MDGGLWRRMTMGLIIRNAEPRHITVSQPSGQTGADPGPQNDLIDHFGEDFAMKQLLLATALIAFPVAVFSGVEHFVIGAAAPRRLRRSRAPYRRLAICRNSRRS